MRAARYDVAMEAGAECLRVVQLWAPDTTIPVTTLVAGDRMYLDGIPEKVHSVELTPGAVTIRFRDGLWHQPSIVLAQTDKVMRAKPWLVSDAKAAFGTTPGSSKIVPTSVNLDGYSVTFGFTADDSNMMAPYEGAHPWDLFVLPDPGEWVRIIEGTWIVLIGQARGSAPIPMPRSVRRLARYAR